MLTYPANETVLEELVTRPELAGSPQLRNLKLGTRSPLEIVRLLLNLHYDHLEALVNELERLYEPAGEIRKRFLQQTNPFQQQGALAEFLVFAHLHDRLGGAVHPVPTGAQAGHDITVDWDGREVRLEVYSPADVVGFQRFKYLLSQAFKYAAIPRGFHVSLHVESRDGGVALEFPTEQEVLQWFNSFASEVGNWLATGCEGDRRDWSGPGGLVTITATIEMISNESNERFIASSGPHQSTDSLSLFRDFPGSRIARTNWARKVREKLVRNQCGPARIGVLRGMILDFGGLDASERDFLNDPRCAAHIDDVIRLLAGGPPPPYDFVVPADIRIDCGFGPAIVLDESRRTEIERFIHDAELNIPVVEPETEDPNEFFDTLRREGQA